MVKILFVCHGNICRSPMAEFVMKNLVEKSGIAQHFEIESAAVSSEEIGNAVYPPVRRILSANGISSEGKYARKITSQDYRYFDLIVAMDSDNLHRIRNICGADTDNKVCLLKKFLGNPNGEVSDPWYSGNFNTTWDEITAGCQAILKYCQDAKLIY